MEVEVKARLLRKTPTHSPNITKLDGVKGGGPTASIDMVACKINTIPIPRMLPPARQHPK